MLLDRIETILSLMSQIRISASTCNSRNKYSEVWPAGDDTGGFRGEP